MLSNQCTLSTLRLYFEYCLISIEICKIANDNDIQIFVYVADSVETFIVEGIWRGEALVREGSVWVCFFFFSGVLGGTGRGEVSGSDFFFLGGNCP